MALKARLAAAEKRLGGLRGPGHRRLKIRHIYEDGAGRVTKTVDEPLTLDALHKSMKDYAKTDAYEVLNIHIIDTKAAPAIGGDVDALAAEVKALERERDELRKGRKKNAAR
ncbi:MAG: hypothetical protein IMZ46_13145 [Acidobacteria bacterium]|nr:hypothetical protein [Acidobacteriota bacterium]